MSGLTYKQTHLQNAHGPYFHSKKTVSTCVSLLWKLTRLEKSLGYTHQAICGLKYWGKQLLANTLTNIHCGMQDMIMTLHLKLFLLSADGQNP